VLLITNITNSQKWSVLFLQLLFYNLKVFFTYVYNWYAKWTLVMMFLVTISLNVGLLLPHIDVYIILWSLVAEEDPTCIGSVQSTEGDQTFQKNLIAQQVLQTSSLSMAPVPLPTAVREGEKLTCQCGSRGPTSYVNAARWLAERSCLAAQQRTP